MELRWQVGKYGLEWYWQLHGVCHRSSDRSSPERACPGGNEDRAGEGLGLGLRSRKAPFLLPALASWSKMAMKDATYAFQKDAYADLEFTNDVGYLPDGTPLNKAGNAVNHPETIGADKHVAGSPLPRAKFVNSVGYLPDGTPMNAAGNAINHPETMQPDPHMAGSPLPPSSYAADVGYLVDGTPLETAGNNSVKGAPATPPPAAAAAFVGSSAPAAPMAASAPPPAAAPTSPGTAMHGRKFEYSFQKDAYADQEFCNDVGYLPDGTPLNRAGNAINHPENIGPDSHAPGSPLPRAIFVNSVGYLPDGTPLNRAGNAINHPESIGPDMHAPGSPLPASVYAADVGYLVDGTPLETAGNNSVKGAPATPPPAAAAAFVGSSAPAAPMAASAPPPAAAPTSPGTAMHGRKFEYSFQKDAYADQEFCNDVGYLPDGTPLNRAGNAINHPENIGPDSHAPGSPLPRAIFVNSVGYLPDGTPLNRAGNAINHPESIGPDMHAPGSPLPASVYAADVGYLVDGTPLETAGNNSVKGAPATPPPAAAAAFVGSSAPAAPMAASAPPPAAAPTSPGTAMHGRKFEYSFQKDAYADQEFCNDVGYLPDGTPLNRAGNAINHPENIGPDSHTPGSPLPRAIFVNSVGYLPDGTPLNRAGNAINHPETIQPDTHTPGSPLPASIYAADVGYLVDGTPMDRAGNLSVQ
ncbi:Ribulose bisphosphate carboxylase, chloroplastic [Symbiodinium microadriaticum]|uniref:Ribulose bisphosphate carboxylase, chloroplastic n=2 Tax=Symbiodinium TaxID=2949 RepID=A0A1Q9EM91_SYMMI|nr:Ribulose bisphosphate carboxylase, chloroplastic [Symbiodinium microadriaticum]